MGAGRQAKSHEGSRKERRRTAREAPRQPRAAPWHFWAGLGVVTVAALAGFKLLVGRTSGLPTFGYRIVHTYPHDPKAFCQGLLFTDGHLYESTGQRGQSTLRKVELETGKVLASLALDDRYFGEGLALARERFFQLTWQARTAFVYDRRTLKRTGKLQYPGEGWGLTHDGRSLIMSDGSANLRFLEPGSFTELRRVRVTAGRHAVANLNELEFVKGEILANVLDRDYLVRISPADGRVTGWIDLHGLLGPTDRTSGTGVLNGIAYDADRDRLFVTGKNWPKLFEIEIVPHAGAPGRNP